MLERAGVELELCQVVLWCELNENGVAVVPGESGGICSAR